MKPTHIVELRELEEVIAFGTAQCFTVGHDYSNCDYLAQQHGYPSAEAAIQQDFGWESSCTADGNGNLSCTVTVSGPCPWD